MSGTIRLLYGDLAVLVPEFSEYYYIPHMFNMLHTDDYAKYNKKDYSASKK